MTSRILVLGTRNRKKLGELAELLDLPAVTLQSVADFPQAPDIDETGSTFFENASLKACTLARHLNQWVLGEDSGICVEALGGAPGIYSARYAGEPCDDERNNDKLLAELSPVSDADRRAHYTCVAVVSDPQGNVRAQTEGRCEGLITRARRGTGGFGYDPLFLIPSEAKTFGELPASFKHAISHRSQALRLLRPMLADLIDRDEWPAYDR